MLPKEQNFLKLSNNFEKKCIQDKDSIVRKFSGINVDPNNIVQKLRQFQPIQSSQNSQDDYEYQNEFNAPRDSVTVFNVYTIQQDLQESGVQQQICNVMKESNFFENNDQNEDYSKYANIDFFEIENQQEQDSINSNSFIVEKEHNQTRISADKDQQKGLFLLHENQFLDIQNQQKQILQQEIDLFFDKTPIQQQIIDNEQQNKEDQYINDEQLDEKNEDFDNLYKQMKESLGLQLWNDFPNDSLDMENFYEEDNAMYETPQKPKISLKDQIQQLLKYTETKSYRIDNQDNFRKAEQIQKQINDIENLMHNQQFQLNNENGIII